MKTGSPLLKWAKKARGNPIREPVIGKSVK